MVSGTRLGFHGPKGAFELNIEPAKSMFEIICDNLKNILKKYGVIIPWYIMTSYENDEETRAYFESKNYFDYPKNNVKFFTQDRLPIIDKYGKIILEEVWKIKEASNGNGDIFSSLKKFKIIDELKSKNISWIYIGGVDNILQKVVDPLFVGLTVGNGCEIASKSVFKKNVDDKDWVFCKRNGKPCIVDYSYITEEMRKSKDENGKYCYREKNILCHLYSISALEKLKDIELPYHRAFKKNPFINYEGVKEVPQSSNSFKFEKFIFDSFEYFNDMILLRVNEEDEFAPIKEFNGIYSPETAIDKYVNYWNKHGVKIIKKEDKTS